MKQNFLDYLRMIQSSLLSKFQSGQAALQMGGPGANHPTDPLIVLYFNLIFTINRVCGMVVKIEI